MDGAIYLFTRTSDQAQTLVRAEFAKLRSGSTSAEHPYPDAPAFSVDRVDLDGHKLLTNHITR